MGRPKFSLKKKSRDITFKKSLKKMAYELSTLCDIDVAMIFYESNQVHEQPDIWPENSTVRRIINRFRNHSKEERVKRSVNLSNFSKELLKNNKFKLEEEEAENELIKLSQVNEDDVGYPTWDDEQVLKDYASRIDAKHEMAKRRIDMLMKGNQLSYVCDGYDAILHQQQPQPLDADFSIDYQYEAMMNYFPVEYPSNALMIFDHDCAMGMNGIDCTNNSSGGGSGCGGFINCGSKGPFSCNFGF